MGVNPEYSWQALVVFQPKFQHSGFNVCAYTFFMYLGSLKAKIVNGVNFCGDKC